MPETATKDDIALDPDPIWDLEVAYDGVELPEDVADEHFGAHFGVTGERTCSASNYHEEVGRGRGGRWTCCRDQHPAHWQHVMVSSRRAYAVWGGTAPVPIPEGAGDPAPPEDYVPSIGVLHKFRNRKDILIPVGYRRNGKVEVVDLTHEKFRVLDKSKLIPRKPDAEPPTPAQMQWYASFLKRKRDASRDNALKQRRDNYFKSDEVLNDVLRELGLPEHTPRRQGSVSIEFQIDVEGLDVETLKRRLLDMLNLEKMPKGAKLQPGYSPSVRTSLYEV